VLAEQEAERAEWEAERAEREAEHQRIQGLEAQQEGLLKFVQQLGEQQGWQIPLHLLAPQPPPPHHPDSTPVSMSTDVLLSMLMVSVKPSDGLRAGFADVWAFVPGLLMCQPSCRKCGCRISCRRFSCRFWKPPCVVEVLPKFSTFSLNWLHFYLVTHVQSLLFCAVSIGGGVEPCRRVADIARRAIPTRTVAGIARWGVAPLTVAVSHLRSRFYVLNL
jgi:hypothetical protein